MAVEASRRRLSDAPILILEPHFDDAALSCAALLDRGRAVDVVTVFAGEPDPPRRGAWDEVCGFADSAEALATRRQEQAAAFAGAAHRVGSLPLLERQYLDGARPDSDHVAIGAAVTGWAARNPAGLVALPAGAGWSAPGVVRRAARLVGRDRVRPHEAHVLVRDAALAVLNADWTPLLYEELPYLFGGRADGAARTAARGAGRRAVAVVEEVDSARKAARIACYASQVPGISPAGAALDDPAALPPVERYWLLEP
ncbi:MAG TPA: hypothetical protein VF236_01885 [Gaiellaceae bacterium]